MVFDSLRHVFYLRLAAVRPCYQEERWGGVDSRKKRNPSREDASVEAMDEDSEQPGETEPKVSREYAVSSPCETNEHQVETRGC